VKHDKILSDNINAKNALLKEIQHRTKNSFTMINSLIRLRTGVVTSDETINVLEDLSLRVKSISDLYSLLHDTNSFFNVPLNIYINNVIESTLKLSNKITLNKNIAEITVPSKNAATIGMILVELLTNSIKYAFPNTDNGIINVDLKVNGFRILLTVEDNGIGLRKDFDINKVTSLGLHLVNLMVGQLNGKMKFILETGTKIEIEIPI
jgi:two-component sensor histidine kinase